MTNQERRTEGVDCRKDAGVPDKLLGAHKYLDPAMADQAHRVREAHRLRLPACVKG